MLVHATRGKGFHKRKLSEGKLRIIQLPDTPFLLAQGKKKPEQSDGCQSTMRVLTPLVQLGRLAYHLYTNDAETTDECRCPSIHIGIWNGLLSTCLLYSRLCSKFGTHRKIFIFFLIFRPLHIHRRIFLNQIQSEPWIYHTFQRKNAVKITLFKTTVFYLLFGHKKRGSFLPQLSFYPCRIVSTFVIMSGLWVPLKTSTRIFLQSLAIGRNFNLLITCRNLA